MRHRKNSVKQVHPALADHGPRAENAETKGGLSRWQFQGSINNFYQPADLMTYTQTGLTGGPGKCSALPHAVVRVSSGIETPRTKLLQSRVDYLPPITEVRVF